MTAAALANVLEGMFFTEDNQLEPAAVNALGRLFEEKGYTITGTDQGAIQLQASGGGAAEATASAVKVPDLKLNPTWTFPAESNWVLHERLKGRDGFQFYRGGECLWYSKGKFFSMGKNITVYNMKDETLFSVSTEPPPYPLPLAATSMLGLWCASGGISHSFLFVSERRLTTCQGSRSST